MMDVNTGWSEPRAGVSGVRATAAVTARQPTARSPEIEVGSWKAGVRERCGVVSDR